MLEISILFENENVLVVNKPPGLVVHPDGKTDEPTLSSWLVEKYPEIKNVGEPWSQDDGTVILRPGIVHRLDKETSGVLVVAKNQKAFEHLKKQFQEGLVEKTYNAFVHGEMKNDEGVIERPIGKSKKDFRLWSAQRGARGTMREAITEYRALCRRDGLSYLEVYPKTGRTHQIRAHMKAVNHPIVCDRLYAPKRECVLGFDRLALHATRISFSDIGGERVVVEAPLPDDFKSALLKLPAP